MKQWWSDHRLRVLAALSHDLRTPLTRLRLRAERADIDTRSAMIREIDRLERMLEETLRYVRDDFRAEPFTRVDLASVLQTLCSEFADVGHAVEYAGPERFTWPCRADALSRAISNLVENALRHGTAVTVSLHSLGAQKVRIEVRDDGPGIDPGSHEELFQPFHIGDADSPTRHGFGLGLAIARDVVRSHGGEISLLQNRPRGLIARVELPRSE